MPAPVACSTERFPAAAEGQVPPSTKVIVSSHDYEKTASEADLMELVEVGAAPAHVIQLPVCNCSCICELVGCCFCGAEVLRRGC